jgi:hypothetical protein
MNCPVNTQLLFQTFLIVTDISRTYLVSYSMEQSPSETNQFAASQVIPAFYGTRRFITTFTSARHLSLSWASPIQSIPSRPTSW